MDMVDALLFALSKIFYWKNFLYIFTGTSIGLFFGALPGLSSFPMAPHLHLSLARTSRPISYDRLDWTTIGDSDALTLLDPIDLIDWEYRIVDDGYPACAAS